MSAVQATRVEVGCGLRLVRLENGRDGRGREHRRERVRVELALDRAGDRLIREISAFNVASELVSLPILKVPSC